MAFRTFVVFHILLQLSDRCFVKFNVLTNRPGRFYGTAQHALHLAEIDPFWFGAMDNALAEAHTLTFQPVFVGVHHICAEDVQADEMFLDYEAYFHFAIPLVGRPAVIHRFFEAGQE
jgi:hypothetical protein